MRNLKVIGLTGSVGSGKTTVANLLQEKYHAYLINSDEVAKRLMEPGQISYEKIVEYFGEGILRPNKEIDRGKLAALVFEDREKLKRLNAFTHPYVQEYILHKINEIREKGEHEYVVVETALLFQVNYERFCDVVWVVVAEDTIRRKRLKESRGYDDEKIDAILANQMSNEEFRTYTPYIIDNSNNLSNIEKQLQNMLECL